MKRTYKMDKRCSVCGAPVHNVAKVSTCQKCRHDQRMRKKIEAGEKKELAYRERGTGNWPPLTRKTKLWRPKLRKWTQITENELNNYMEQKLDNNPIFEDEEALKAIRILVAKGYTSEAVIEQWWRMKRGIGQYPDTSRIEHCRENG